MSIVKDLNSYTNWAQHILNGTMFSNIVKVVGGGYTKEAIDNFLSMCKECPIEDDQFILYNDLNLAGCVYLSELGYKNFYLLLDIRDKSIEEYFFELVYQSKKFKEIFPNGFPFKGIIRYKPNNFFEKFEGACMKLLVNPLIISNPAYGKIGDEITDEIIHNLKNRKEFINLLPLKDYSLKTGKYIDFNSITTFPPHSFPGADILTHAVRILEKPNETIKTDDDLCAAAFTVDRPMIKFMKDNLAKKHYAIDAISGWKATDNVYTTFVFHEFRAKSQHTCGMDLLESKSVANEYNFSNNEIKTKEQAKALKVSGTLEGAYYSIRYNTEIEKQRLVKLYKLTRNFINRMIANQFIGVRDYSACWPKVDLTNDKWDTINTEEEAITAIMKEVNNSTDEEIQAVLNTMNKDYAVKDDDSIIRLFGDYLKD